MLISSSKVFNAMLKPVFKYGKVYHEQLESGEESMLEILPGDDNQIAMRLLYDASKLWEILKQ